MKKLLLLINFLVFLFISLNTVFAESPTASPSAAKAKIEDLKDRLATKVAELTTTQQIAVFGNVKTITVASMIVETSDKDLKIDLADDIKLVQYLKGKRTVLDIEKLEKNDSIVIFGDHDMTLDVVKPKIIHIVEEKESVFGGVVGAVDNKNYTFEISTFEGTTLTIDFEKSTKAKILINDKFEKAGFSNIKADMIVLVNGTNSKESKDRISATKLVLYESINIDSENEPSASASATVSE